MNKEHAKRMLAHLEDKAEHRRNVVAEQPRGGAGKVFHTKAHKRMKNEKYYTPAWATRCLTRNVSFDGDVSEPAAGNGAVAVAFMDGKRRVFASDLEPDDPSSCLIERLDFLATKVSPAKHIVTNPPFGTGGNLAVKFVRHALKLAEYHGGKVAMLLRDDFDSAKGRRELFADHPAFDRKIVLTDRIRWTNLPQNPKKGPSGSHAWFVWDWARNRDEWPIVQYERADEDPLTAAIDRSIG